MMKKYLPLAVLILLFAGCAEQASTQYATGETSSGEQTIGAYNPSSSTTLIGALIKDWRLYSFIFILISIALIAAAYPISNALNSQELRAWADVELGEVITNGLIIVAILVSLVFVEVVTQAILAGQPEFAGVCTTTTYCPVAVADKYINDYLDATSPLYGDMMENSLNYGTLGTLSAVLGSNYLYTGYISSSFKIVPQFMIDVQTETQMIQFLFTMRDSLYFQEFLLNHVSNTLAPLALMCGIVLRSFFLTRKLGGLLIAFGVGFLLVFPATYALAAYTVQTTLHGATGTGGTVSSQFCTQSCMASPPLAYVESSGEGLTRSEIADAIAPDLEEDEEESDEDYTERMQTVDDFIAGEHCEGVWEEVATDNNGDGEQDEDDEGNPLTHQEYSETCNSVSSTMDDTSLGTLISCGQYDEQCPLVCRTLPYPNNVLECAARATERYCRDTVPEECFLVRYTDSTELEDLGFEEADRDCPLECWSVLGLQKEGCDVGDGTFLGDEDEDGELDGTEMTDSGCPNQCRWISTTGRTGAGCDVLCSSEDYETFPSNPGELWQNAFDAASASSQIISDNPDGLSDEQQEQVDNYAETQREISEDLCVMVVPDDLFTNQECDSCSYLIDKGFGMMPNVHLDCDALCGKVTNTVAVEDEGSLESDTDGFSGPSEMKSITKLIIPAMVLPMFNVVITFMFIKSLSQVLGGDIDLPGMMEMIK